MFSPLTTFSEVYNMPLVLDVVLIKFAISAKYFQKTRDFSCYQIFLAVSITRIT